MVLKKNSHAKIWNNQWYGYIECIQSCYQKGNVVVLQLLVFIKYQSQPYHGLSTKEFALASNKAVPENWMHEKTAGKEWLAGFMDCHKELSFQ